MAVTGSPTAWTTYYVTKLFLDILVLMLHQWQILTYFLANLSRLLVLCTHNTCTEQNA